MKRERAAFITGAASGIGRATAKLFAGRGWFIGAADIDAAGLRSLREELPPDSCATWRLDVTDSAAFNATLQEFGDKAGGRLDLMFNNAGVCAAGRYSDVPRAVYRQMMTINIEGVMNGTDAALPLLKKTANSLLLNTSSAAAIYGLHWMAVYSATKAAVKALTEALAVELRLEGVRAADLLPGLIHTSIHKNMRVYVGGHAVSDASTAIASAPAEGPGRVLEAEAVAEAAWRAYHEDVVHSYIPEDLDVLVHKKARSAEEMRDMNVAALMQRFGAGPKP